jgi:hypothetical protein
MGENTEGNVGRGGLTGAMDRSPDRGGILEEKDVRTIFRK